MNRSKLIDALCWVGVVCIAIALGAYGYISSTFHHDHAIRADGCLAYLKPPAALALVDDTTDKLEGDQPRRWHSAVGEQIGKQMPGAALLFTTIGARVPPEIAFDTGPCVPPPGNSVRARAVRDALDATLTRIEKQLEDARTVDHSAISGTILAAATDRAFAVSPRRELLVASDCLENDGKVSAYRRKGLVLPLPVGTPLKGTTIYFLVLQNQRDARFQTPALLRTWIAWAKAAGAAKVVVDAPWLGFVPPDEGLSGGQS